MEKTCLSNTRDMFTHGQLLVDPHAEIADDGRWLDDTAVNPNGRVRWKPPEVRRRAEPKKQSCRLVAVQLQSLSGTTVTDVGNAVL